MSPLLNTADKVFMGQQEVLSAYRGNDLVYESGPPIPPYSFSPAWASQDPDFDFFLMKPQSVPSFAANQPNEHTIEFTWNTTVTGSFFQVMGGASWGRADGNGPHPIQEPYSRFKGLYTGIVDYQVTPGCIASDQITMGWYDYIWDDFDTNAGFWQTPPSPVPGQEAYIDFDATPPDLPGPRGGAWSIMIMFLPSTTVPAGKCTLVLPYGRYVER